MFGELAVCYLFLGGAGAAAIALAALVDLVQVKELFGVNSHTSVAQAAPSERIVAFGFLAGFAALVFGVLCLVFDLGRLDRALALLFNPSLTYLTVGAFSLLGLAVLGALLVGVRFLYLPFFVRRTVAGIEVVAMIVAFVVMAYTGLLLQGLGGVALWRSPLVPALFVLSSLSCGAAVLLVVSMFVEVDAGVRCVVRALVRADAVVIVLEAAVAALFVAFALDGGHGAGASSAQRLVDGDLATWWWVGFVLCGLVAPLVAEGAFVVRGDGVRALRAALAVAAVLALVGGFSMRLALVDAGAHRDLKLEEPSAQALRSD